MNDPKEFLDLSLIKNQNTLAIKIANFFDKEELDLIDLTKVNNENRDIDSIQYIYYNKEFKNKKSIKIIDTMILDIFPACRYITIRLSNGDIEQFDYKCKYSKNIIKILNSLFAKVYNYKYWSGEFDKNIIRSHIVNNYSKKLSSDVDKETLEEARFVITYLINDGSIKNNNNFSYDFSINKKDFHIESNEYGQVQFSYRNNENEKFNRIYFDKTDTGISNINLIIEQALNL
jgi:hypothetical protein